MKEISENWPTAAIIHLIAALLSVAGLVILVVFASLKATAWHVIGFSIFGASLILLYLVSTLFHFFTGKLANLFKKFDYSMIFVLIAGTYTPICLIPLRGVIGWTLFGLIWGFAIAGIVLVSVFGPRNWITMPLYIIMGWLIVIAIKPLTQASYGAFIWLLIGGLAYTLGTIFFWIDIAKSRKRRWWGWHEIWHISVMLGSISHFFAMLNYL